jgi:hypothetical protein
LVGEVFSFVGYALWAWYVFFPPSPSDFLSFTTLILIIEYLPPSSKARSRPIPSLFGADGRYYYEKKFDECRGVIQPEMALPMGIPGAFGLPVSVSLFRLDEGDM